MPTILDKYVDAFGDSLLNAHREAMICADAEDFLAFGTTLAKRIKAHCDTYLPTQDPDLRRGLEQTINAYLKFAKITQVLAGGIAARGYSLTGAEDFEDAVLAVRDALCRIQEPIQAGPVKLPTDFSVSPPPDSWHQEDHSGLSLPRISER
jgi:hypothetical protein